MKYRIKETVYKDRKSFNVQSKENWYNFWKDFNTPGVSVVRKDSYSEIIQYFQQFIDKKFVEVPKKVKYHKI